MIYNHVERKQCQCTVISSEHDIIRAKYRIGTTDKDNCKAIKRCKHVEIIGKKKEITQRSNIFFKKTENSKIDNKILLVAQHL